MTNRAHLGPLSVRRIEVIYVRAQRGNGTPGNPDRTAEYYYSLNGDLLACFDPINGPPDNFEALPAPSTNAGVVA